MSGNVFGKKSYEYAVGSIRASSHPPLSPEQWNRLREADLEGVGKLLGEYGYPVTPGGQVLDAIQGEQARAVTFVRDLAPDEALTRLLFFEEDALNLKLLLKAQSIGAPLEGLPLVEGSFPYELLRVCVETQDYSLLGKKIEERLTGIQEETDPCRISCRVDAALYEHAVTGARRLGCAALAKMLETYGAGKNRLTALRLARLKRSAQEYAFAFLPEKDERVADTGKSEADILREVNRSLEDALEEMGYDEGMGALAQYYYAKKNDAAALRRLYAEKSLAAAGGETA